MIRLRRERFPLNVWPPLVDAMTLVLAGFVFVILAALVVQRGLMNRLADRETQVAALAEEKSRIERQLRGVAATGPFEIVDGKVIVQGELLFATGSAQVTDSGLAKVRELAVPLRALLDEEPDQMILVGGHTDDRPIRNERFDSNWELSTARAVAVARALEAAGIPASRVVAAGFGEHHPRRPNVDEEGRRQNRRIEVLLVPIRSVASGPGKGR